jgi:hypothetical protein
MDTFHITRYSSYNNFPSDEFEDALSSAALRYSLEHLILTGMTSGDDILKALQKSIQVCALTGVNSRHHFRKIFVFDSTTGALHTDWLMSKKGFNLMIIHSPLLNEKIARWHWQLAELK